jgi:hypothetical protein
VYLCSLLCCSLGDARALVTFICVLCTRRAHISRSICDFTLHSTDASGQVRPAGRRRQRDSLAPALLPKTYSLILHSYSFTHSAYRRKRSKHVRPAGRRRPRAAQHAHTHSLVGGATARVTFICNISALYARKSHDQCATSPTIQLRHASGGDDNDGLPTQRRHLRRH